MSQNSTRYRYMGIIRARWAVDCFLHRFQAKDSSPPSHPHLPPTTTSHSALAFPPHTVWIHCKRCGLPGQVEVVGPSSLPRHYDQRSPSLSPGPPHREDAL